MCLKQLWQWLLCNVLDDGEIFCDYSQRKDLCVLDIVKYLNLRASVPCREGEVWDHVSSGVICSLTVSRRLITGYSGHVIIGGKKPTLSYLCSLHLRYSINVIVFLVIMNKAFPVTSRSAGDGLESITKIVLYASKEGIFKCIAVQIHCIKEYAAVCKMYF